MQPGFASKSQQSLSSVTKFPAFYGPHSQHPAKKIPPQARSVYSQTSQTISLT